MISRIKFDQVEEGLLFCQEAYANLVGTPTSLYSVGIDLELTHMYLQSNVDTHGKKNKFELPLSKAFRAEEECNKIITDEQNYILAKVQVNIGKVYLAQRAVADKEKAAGLLDKAELLFKQALGMIAILYTDEHPLAAKYNQNLVESMNARPESNERTQTLTNLCEKNYQIAKNYFGENSIYLLRVLYTRYTAALHEETSESSDSAMTQMASIVHEGEPVRANQFLYKAILLDTIMMMNSGSETAGARIEMQLS